MSGAHLRSALLRYSSLAEMSICAIQPTSTGHFSGIKGLLKAQCFETSAIFLESAAGYLDVVSVLPTIVSTLIFVSLRAWGKLDRGQPLRYFFFPYDPKLAA
jgi:hypothetical protein